MKPVAPVSRIFMAWLGVEGTIRLYRAGAAHPAARVTALIPRYAPARRTGRSWFPIPSRRERRASMTDIARVFLGWDGPVLPRVAGWLLEKEARLGEVVVVVPGRRSGRLLLSHLVALVDRQSASRGLRPAAHRDLGIAPRAVLSTDPTDRHSPRARARLVRSAGARGRHLDSARVRARPGALPGRAG